MLATTIEVISTAATVFIVIVGMIMLGGEPDLTDAIRKYIDKKTDMLECEHASTK